MSTLRKYAKLLSLNRNDTPERALHQLVLARSAVEPNEFPQLLSAFRRVSVVSANVDRRKIADFSHLYWVAPQATLAIEDEFAWAEHWLKPLAALLSRHAAALQAYQELFCVGDFEGLRVAAEKSIKDHGWSFWATELLIASNSLVRGYADTLSLISTIGKSAANRNSGLLLQMIADRNDPELSPGLFRSKCSGFFKKIDKQSRSGVIRMRSTRQFDDTDQMSCLMAWNLASSHLDYYEDLLSVIDYLRVNPTSGVSRDSLRGMLHSLTRAGVQDYRLQKLEFLLRDVPEVPEVGVHSSRASDLVDRCFHFDGFNIPFFPESLDRFNEAAKKCEVDGALAQSSAELLLSTSLNFASLPVAQGLEGKGFQRFVEIIDDGLVAGGGSLGSMDMTLGEVAALEADQIESFINAGSHSEAKSLKKMLEGHVDGLPIKPHALHAWVINRLIDNRRYSDAQILVNHLATFGGVWLRTADKLRMKLLKEQGSLEEALGVACKWLLASDKYVFEFPVAEILKKTNWSRISRIPPWKTGLVANAAYDASRNANNRYLCRKSCVAFFQLVTKKGLEQLYLEASEAEKPLICEFLRTTWIDQNLTLVHGLPSIEDVRKNRLHVLQLLREYDPDRADEYREEIQEITLDESLWHGLRELDANRVFVNEAAITRWGEKEFGETYARFQRFQAGGDLSARIHDPEVRGYLIEGDVASLMQIRPEVSEVGLLLTPIFSGLFNRFMTDPTDGLNAYLSLRIRHGTLRGTLLSSTEEERVLIVGPESEMAFLARFAKDLSAEEIQSVLSVVKDFSLSLESGVSQLVNEMVQIRSAERPAGIFDVVLDEPTLRSVLQFADPSWSFHSFANQCYSIFWRYLDPARTRLADYLRVGYRQSCEESFEQVIAALSGACSEMNVQPVLIALQSSLTKMLASIDIVANWFVSGVGSNERTYSLKIALEIAEKATGNVYPDFEINRNDDFDDCSEVLLSASGLYVVYDSLFVVLGNIWTRSGLRGRCPEVSISVRWNPDSSLLHFTIKNSLDDAVRRTLEGGRLQELRLKYLSSCTTELVAAEGGSGFAKLSRIARSTSASKPGLEFYLSDMNFCVEYPIQLHMRDGVYDAFL